MADVTLIKEAAHSLMVKRKNKPLCTYIEELENELGMISSGNCGIADDLDMNNQILDENFQELVLILVKLDESIQAISNSIISPDGAIGGVTTATGKMTVTYEMISDCVKTQTSSLTEFFAALEEMTASIKNVHSSTDEAGRVVNKTVENVIRGNTLIKESLQAIESIKESTEKISNISNIIQSISGQSSMLAMNAAIEAAHAGKAGKGFAVVAEEMRKLSENSRVEADKINKIIKEVVAGIDNASNSTQRVTQNNNDIVNNVKQVNDITNQIQLAMKEQSIGTEVILQEVKHLNEETSKVKEAISEQQNANTNLDGSIGELKQAAENVEKVLRLEERIRNDMVDIINKIGRTYLRNLGILHSIRGV